VPTAFVGAVGGDVFGVAAIKFHESEGIGARFVVKPGHATGTAAIFVDAAAQNEIIGALGAARI
jgi:sugar/nucleoside kinase (ribokinase family)